MIISGRPVYQLCAASLAAALVATPASAGVLDKGEASTSPHPEPESTHLVWKDKPRMHPSGGGNPSLELKYCIVTTPDTKGVLGIILDTVQKEISQFANVKFSHSKSEDTNCSTSNDAIDFVVMSHRFPLDMFGNYQLAESFNPNTDKKEDRTLKISERLIQKTDGSNYRKLQDTTLHEFGHILGLRHEYILASKGYLKDLKKEKGTEIATSCEQHISIEKILFKRPVQIVGTKILPNGFDPSSVMQNDFCQKKADQAARAQGTLTFADRVSLACLYYATDTMIALLASRGIDKTKACRVGSLEFLP